SWMLDGIFIGATKTREMRNAMLQSAVMFAVIAWGFVWAFGNHGLWAALLVSYVLRTLTLWRYYPRIEAEALA
ncbi:MAG TPA: MATE family efflux transporter, partial [Paracoccaceae bacterium]|nr:MATE family efflux transporter [Paracoccaceae bacterium]